MSVIDWWQWQLKWQYYAGGSGMAVALAVAVFPIIGSVSGMAVLCWWQWQSLPGVAVQYTGGRDVWMQCSTCEVHYNGNAIQ